MPFTSAVLDLDVDRDITRIAEWLRATVLGTLKKRGVVLGLSGGIDSSVVGALAAKALGPDRVLGIFTPERHSSDDSLELGQLLAKAIGIPTVLGEDLLRDDPDYAHRYRLRDDRGRALLDHGGIYLLELNKFAAERVETEQERWLKFFRDGKRLDNTELPEWMQAAELRQAKDEALAEIERLKALLQGQETAR